MGSSIVFDEVLNIDEYNDEACGGLNFFGEYPTGDSGYYSAVPGNNIVDPFDFGAADIQNASEEPSQATPMCIIQLINSMHQRLYILLELWPQRLSRALLSKEWNVRRLKTLAFRVFILLHVLHVCIRKFRRWIQVPLAPWNSISRQIVST